MKFNSDLKFGVLLFGLSLCIPANSQLNASVAEEKTDEDQVVIPPLFEYVVAPDNLPDLQSRTDYLMEHFWDPFDFKKSGTVDQNALNHAFGVYVYAMPYATPSKVDASVKSLIKKIKNNPGLSYQFAKSAEETLYGPRAELWGDGVYIEFLNNVVNNKKIKDSQKKHFAEQLALISRSAVGAPFPSLDLVNVIGSVSKFSPSKDFALIEFRTPDCTEGQYTNLKLDISGIVNDLLEDGKLEVDVIFMGDKVPAVNFPEKWNVYASTNASDIMDIRTDPSFFIIGKDGKIAGKNLTVDDAINLLEELMLKSDK